MEIFPGPRAWVRVHEQLIDFAKHQPCAPASPPGPMILGGWVWSSDIDKLERWREMRAWAEANGASHILDTVRPEEMFRVAVPSSYRLNEEQVLWNHGRRVPPTTEDEQRHLSRLREGWTEIAGPAACDSTSPIAFTGRCRRRLLVRILDDRLPPWGAWDRIDTDRRGHFTDFRKRVNAAIAPHEVDHIEFTTDSSAGRKRQRPSNG